VGDQPRDPPPQPPSPVDRNRVLLAVAVVVVIAVVVGFAAYAAIKPRTAELVSADVSPTPSSEPTALQSPSPVPTPTPEITPRQARITLSLRFELTFDSLGDPHEALVLAIRSNVPVPFDGYADNVLFRGVNISRDRVAFSIEMAPGAEKEFRFTFDGRAPRGMYTVWFDVPSYPNDVNAGQVNLQTDEYNRWVGGDQGPRLKGNAQAVRDAAHPAVLNLRAVKSITHK
jgi:hypothetical protein